MSCHHVLRCCCKGSYADQSRHADDSRPKKRGRAPKGPEDLALHDPAQSQPGQLPTPVTSHSTQSQSAHQQHQQAQQNPLPQAAAPKQTSPTKTATKSVVKALPTVRDHTTDQLNAEADEFIPREIDEAGESKVQPNGRLEGTREYKCRTFLVPNRGDKLFMLATECARILGYRDSYLLFNKNRSLHKIIASQPEKEDLIHQDILPYSYRSRQIAIVTAKSMFRQFGSRVVVDGRRVRDDYWEGKARKQGFTEEDMAGEKRPGGAKREAQQAAEAASQAAAGHAPGNINYIDVSGGPHLHNSHTMPGYPSSQFLPALNTDNRLPMIDPQYQSRDSYSDIQRPRQEVSGPAYQDRTLPSSMNDIMNQAGHAAEFNKGLTAQRSQRANIYHDNYRKELPTTSPVQDNTAAPSTSLSSPHMPMSGGMLPPQGSQQGYPQHVGNSQGSPQAMRTAPPNIPQRSSTMSSNYGQGVPPSPSSSYAYGSQQFSYPPQQSPMSSQHAMPSYGAPHTPGHPQQPPSPHPSQSPQHLPAGSHGGQPGMQPPPQNMYGQMQPMGGMQQSYGNIGRPLYQAQPSPHAYMPNTPGQPGGINSNWNQSQQNWQPQY